MSIIDDITEKYNEEIINSASGLKEASQIILSELQSNGLEEDFASKTCQEASTVISEYQSFSILVSQCTRICLNAILGEMEERCEALNNDMIGNIPSDCKMGISFGLSSCSRDDFKLFMESISPDTLELIAKMNEDIYEKSNGVVPCRYWSFSDGRTSYIVSYDLLIKLLAANNLKFSLQFRQVTENMYTMILGFSKTPKEIDACQDSSGNCK